MMCHDRHWRPDGAPKDMESRLHGDEHRLSTISILQATLSGASSAARGLTERQRQSSHKLCTRTARVNSRALAGNMMHPYHIHLELTFNTATLPHCTGDVG
jgi:hypothetical protein